MAATQTVRVSHLGGIEVGYKISGSATRDVLDNSKPTCVLINALHTTVAFWRPQFEDKVLTSTANLLAIEPLGHGATSCSTEYFTYWDTAIMALEAMDKFGVEKAFAMGTSQGGFIVARMALLAPHRIQGIVPIGTSMDSESEETRRRGSWDAHSVCDPYLERWSSTTPTPDFVIDEDWCRNVPALAYGDGSTPEELQYWFDTWRKLYSGDEGRRKARMAVLCLVERDGLLSRLSDVKCPVHWLHLTSTVLLHKGSKDAIWPDELAREQIKLFTASPSTKITVLAGGSHFLSITNARDVNAILSWNGRRETNADYLVIEEIPRHTGWQAQPSVPDVSTLKVTYSTRDKKTELLPFDLPSWLFLATRLAQAPRISSLSSYETMLKVRGKKWTLAAMALLTILSYHNLLRIYYVSKIDDLRNHAPPLSREEAEGAGFAYVFYATSDAYACSALVNIHQLRTLGSAVPSHVLASEGVSKAYIDAFADAGVKTHIEKTPKLPLEDNHYYEDCLLKLVVFKMHTLDPSLNRVLLFDSDQLILKHFDNLFSDIPLVDLAAPRAYWLRGKEAVFSSAFMLINLSDRLWASVNKTIATSVENFGGREPKFDMDIINDELGDTVTVLSGEYVTLNSHWEAWDLPNWYHPEERKNTSHTESKSPLKKATRFRRPTKAATQAIDDDQVSPAATAKANMDHSEDSDIYKDLVELYNYTSIVHFTALGKPWMFTAEEVVQGRRGAHPAFALQFGHWQNVAEQVCPEGYLMWTLQAALSNKAGSRTGEDQSD